MNSKGWLASAAFGALVAIGGCASDAGAVRMTASRDIPAAMGTVVATQTDNDNTKVRVEVEHMAPPQRVSPGATTYVVWARAAGQAAPVNLGALKVDRNLKGTLVTVTPLRNFEVFVTAEPSPTVTTPTSQHFLSASVERTLR